ncbi:helix-turn-helix domain-containing protein [Paenibacillus alkaliterrae]|uniref:helix-turn-helix domain-containing protein n=1 Tax=Paenibacillus alkaliterrae TaxID=320909 RepID=UPI0039EF39C0
MVFKEMLNTMYTVKEMSDLLQDHHIGVSEQMIRRYLRKGKIEGVRPTNRKVGWTIPGHEVFRYWDSLQYEGTIYEEGIDESTRIKRLFAKVKSLERINSELSRENHDLRVRIGLEDDVPF